MGYYIIHGKCECLFCKTKEKDGEDAAIKKHPSYQLILKVVKYNFPPEYCVLSDDDLLDRYLEKMHMTKVKEINYTYTIKALRLALKDCNQNKDENT